MSEAAKQNIRLWLNAATTILVALCLFVLKSTADEIKVVDKKVGIVDGHLDAHLQQPEVHETFKQKTAARRDTARNVIVEWDQQVNKPRWDDLHARLDRIENKMGGKDGD